VGRADPSLIGGLEKLIFNTSHFGHMVLHRFGGGGEDSVSPSGSMPIDSMTHLTGEIRNDAWLVDRAHPLRHPSRHSGSIAPLARAFAPAAVEPIAGKPSFLSSPPVDSSRPGSMYK